MLNLLCDAAQDLQEVLYIFAIFIGMVIFIVSTAKKSLNKPTPPSDSQGTNSNYPFSNHPNATGQLTPEQQRYQNSLRQRQTAQKPTTSPVTGADGHAHIGSTVESYDPIVGSLGDVSDEGCDELDGVRLIVTDLRYETDDHEVAYDLQAIRKSLILGEVLNKPRFKHPYGKK